MPDGEYRCRLEGALFFSSYVLYDGTFTTSDEAITIYPTPQYSYEKSSHIDMIGQVKKAYYTE